MADWYADNVIESIASAMEKASEWACSRVFICTLLIREWTLNVSMGTKVIHVKGVM